MPRSQRAIDPQAKYAFPPYSWRDPSASLPGVEPEQLDITDTVNKTEYETGPHVPPVEFQAKPGPRARGVE